mmetsp:Transcript_21946/g.51517  ORF Transcript_21946/g.51517 Transcript_21946/m.51517 type:complete len:229 (+) Transcript_21946:109-795(+)
MIRIPSLDLRDLHHSIHPGLHNRVVIQACHWHVVNKTSNETSQLWKDGKVRNGNCFAAEVWAISLKDLGVVAQELTKIPRNKLLPHGFHLCCLFVIVCKGVPKSGRAHPNIKCGSERLCEIFMKAQHLFDLEHLVSGIKRSIAKSARPPKHRVALSPDLSINLQQRQLAIRRRGLELSPLSKGDPIVLELRASHCQSETNLLSCSLNVEIRHFGHCQHSYSGAWGRCS